MSVKCCCEQSLSMFRRTRPMNSESFIQLLSETSRMLGFFTPRTNWSEAVDCNALRPAGDEHYLSDDKIVWKLSWGGRIRGEQGFMEILPEMFKLLNLHFGWRHCLKTPLYSDFLDCRKVSKSLDLLISLQFTRIYSFPRQGLMKGSKVDMFWRFFFGTFAGRHDDARACLCTGEACR